MRTSGDGGLLSRGILYAVRCHWQQVVIKHDGKIMTYNAVLLLDQAMVYGIVLPGYFVNLSEEAYCICQTLWKTWKNRKSVSLQPQSRHAWMTSTKRNDTIKIRDEFDHDSIFSIVYQVLWIFIVLDLYSRSDLDFLSIALNFLSISLVNDLYPT